MKAAQPFSILIDEVTGEQVVGRGKVLTVKKNEEVPDRYVTDLIQSNPAFLQLEYVEGRVKLSAGEKEAYESARQMKSEPRKAKKKGK